MLSKAADNILTDMRLLCAAVEVTAAIQRIRQHTQEAWTEGVSLVTSSKSPDKPTLKFGDFAPFSESIQAELASISSPVLLQACAGRIPPFAMDSLYAPQIVTAKTVNYGHIACKIRRR